MGRAVAVEFAFSGLDAVEDGGEKGTLHVLGKNGFMIREKGHRAGGLHDREGAAVADRGVEFGMMADRVAEADDVAEDGIGGWQFADAPLPRGDLGEVDAGSTLGRGFTGPFGLAVGETCGVLFENADADLALGQAHLDRDEKAVELRSGQGKSAGAVAVVARRDDLEDGGERPRHAIDGWSD